MQSPKKAEAWTILKVLRWAAPYFKERGVESPRASAEILLAHSLGLQRLDLYLQYDKPLSAEELARFKSLIKRRVKHEPVAYILGQKEFWSMELDLSPAVLIPRPETELLVEAALEVLPQAGDEKISNVLELGTGSGAIILAIASERPGHRFFASDKSPAALKTARGNAQKHGLSEKIRFFGGDWFAPLKERGIFFDLIVSNPPYICSSVMPELQPDVREYEPKTALDGGPEGLDDIRVLIQDAQKYLSPGGWLMLEIGYDQRDALISLGREAGCYENIEVKEDYGGNPRVAMMRRL